MRDWCGDMDGIKDHGSAPFSSIWGKGLDVLSASSGRARQQTSRVRRIWSAAEVGEKVPPAEHTSKLNSPEHRPPPGPLYWVVARCYPQ